MRVIELDNNATTRPDERVVAAVVDAMTGLPGNPSSTHTLGRRAAQAVDNAREQVSAALGARPREVTFTSGATEANNLALLGTWAAHAGRTSRNRIVVGATEHPSVLEAAAELRRRGADVEIAPVDSAGRIDLDALRNLVTSSTLLVSIMAANNETGVLAPVAQIAEIAHVVGAWFHTDATQAIGRIPVSFTDWGVDLLSMSGHKIHGPRAIGTLIADPDVRLNPLLHGGGQERNLRPGTLNTPGIVGLGTACGLIDEYLGRSDALQALRDRFWQALQEQVPGAALNASLAPRLPNTLNVRFHRADAEAVVAGMPDVACSTGSACSAATPTPSPVLLAMGLGRKAASESIRFSLSARTSGQDVQTAVAAVAASVSYVRAMSGEVVA